ncbi:hypothetical protein F5X96DRAFT_108560 [Biscogniauxia mediterranea]|nr:hypothetical protein F5X96DRAFT_108560 [Biscogniauxia mediterranea]
MLQHVKIAGVHAVRANAAMTGRRPIGRRQIVFGNGTLTVGGITLSSNGNKAAAAAASNSTVNAEASAVSNSTANAEVSAASNSTANAEALIASNSTANAEASAAPVAEEPAEVAEEVSQGNATKGEEAGAGAAEEAAEEAAEGAAEGEKAAAEGITAVNEAEQFSENIGIITDARGNTVNLGGDLGITRGSDGSISVGGAAGINIVA